MAHIAPLTNRTRSTQRPPLLAPAVSHAVLASIFKLAVRHPARPVKAARKPASETPAASRSAAIPASQAPQKTRFIPRPAGNQPLEPQPRQKPEITLPDAPAQKPAQAAPADRTAAGKPPVVPLHGGGDPPSPAGQSRPAPGYAAGPTDHKNGAAQNGKAKEDSGKDAHSPHSQLFPLRSYPHAGVPHSPARPIVQVPLELPRPDTNGYHNGANGSKPAIHNEPAQPDPVERAPAGAPAPVSAHTRPISTGPQPAEPQPAKDILPAVERFLREQPGLPAQTALLGVCDDGLPVLLDLNDPNPGALIVIGDEREEQLDLLHAVFASLVTRNTPRGVQVMVISCEPQSWKSWIAERGFDRFCLAVEGVDQADTLRDWIFKLGDWTEQRRLGERSGPPIVLLMDTLSFLPRLDYDVRLNFDWMVKEGPAAQIWPVAAISTDLALMLNTRRMMRSFRTRILGFTDRAGAYTQLASLDAQAAASFGQPGRFAVLLGENWLRFHLPGHS